jgi:PTS system cellobiose-specific IIC component
MGKDYSELQGKFQEAMGAFANNKYIKSISNGMLFIMTPIIVGSIFTLLVNLPIPAYLDFIKSTGLSGILGLPIHFTSDIMALLASFFIAFSLAKQFGKDGGMAGLLSLICFLILTPLGSIENGPLYISFDWLGAKGLIVAIIVGLIVSRIYVFFVDKGITIKLPESVPPAVSNSFGGLIPGFATVILSVVIAGLFKATPFGSLDQMIYSCLQVPLEHVTGSLGALILVEIFICVLWFFGIHGTILALGLIMPLYMSLDMQNLAAFQAGTPLPNIIGFQFLVCFVLVSGTGVTMGLTLLMAFRAKSQQYKILGRLALPTSLFNINEPIMFGTPIVLNPFMLLPFVAAPVVSTVLAYVAMATGLVPRLNGVQIPWPTPMIISGFIEGGWRVALLQIVCMVSSVLIYFVPFKMLDAKAYDLEKNGVKAE